MNPELLLLGVTIRRLRQSLHISQEELADRAGLHRTYLSDVERGNRNLSFLALLGVARALGLTISELTSVFGNAVAAAPAPPGDPQYCESER